MPKLLLAPGEVVNVHLERFEKLTFGGLDRIETPGRRLWRGDVVKDKK